MDERQVHCTALFERSNYLIIAFYETYEPQPEPPEVFVNEVPRDMDYELKGEVHVKMIGNRSWDLVFEEEETVSSLLERIFVSPDDKTIKISHEEERTHVWILFPIRGSAPFKWGGLRWQFHKHDADPWPSTPHGHCKEKHWVLDPYTGEVYDSRTRKSVDNIGKKGLAALHACLNGSKDFSHYLFDSANTPRPA